MTQRKIGTPLKFVVVGIANTLVGLFAIYLCKWLLGFSDALANISGYMIGLAVSFLLNRGWTFRHSGAVLPALARFLVIFALAYLLNLATVLIAIHSLGVNSYLAQAIGIAPYTVFFFLGSRYFAFRSAPARRQ
jgi:putative flippase GtrA